MEKSFNTTGDCKPGIHYMVDLTKRLEEIKKMVDKGQYFTINRARQYGKTTTLKALKRYLENEYLVIRLDFQRLSHACFETEARFVKSFSTELLERGPIMPDEIVAQLDAFQRKDACELRDLSKVIVNWCGVSEQKIVLLIDEVDSATNNQVFLDFLALLRNCYLDRDEFPTFQSVILAGVYDVKNIKRKLRPDEEHKVNSPWNIAAPFNVRMSFTPDEIAGMLKDYEVDYHTGMDVENIADLLYDYTSGYPFLVSQLCKLIDEMLAGTEAFPDKPAAWTERGCVEAVRLLMSEQNTLFESLSGKLVSYPQLRQTIYALLFSGDTIAYSPFDQAVNDAMMFGFVRKQDGNIIVANRIFETLLYNYFLTSMDAQGTPIYKAASHNKSQFVRDDRLDMDTVLRKYVKHFNSIYGDNPAEFNEEEGRRRFLLYLRPIINGVGNYYVEAETRNSRRMDVVVDYLGERFVIELKIWRGASYNERGEQQLADYLDYFKLRKGYMLSYNFNQKKEVGVREINIGDRVLVEAVV